MAAAACAERQTAYITGFPRLIGRFGVLYSLFILWPYLVLHRIFGASYGRTMRDFTNSSAYFRHVVHCRPEKHFITQTSVIKRCIFCNGANTLGLNVFRFFFMTNTMFWSKVKLKTDKLTITVIRVMTVRVIIDLYNTVRTSYQRGSTLTPSSLRLVPLRR